MGLNQMINRARTDNWYRDRYDEYVTHRDVNAELSAMEIILSRPDRDRRGSWSASDSGACLRKRQFTYLGMDKRELTPEAMNIFANGDYVHIRHQAFGLAGRFIDKVEVPVHIDKIKFRGTADAISSAGEGLEFKSINDRGFSGIKSFGASPKHLLQIAAYEMCLNLGTWRIIYENKNTNEMLEIVVNDFTESLKTVVTEITTLNGFTEKNKLVPMLRSCLNQTGFDYTYCPYNRNCKEDMTWPRESQSSGIKLVIPLTSSSGRS